MAASSKKSKTTAKSVSTARNWKRNKGEELELPSKNVALVKRPGPQALLKDGILPDTLMPIVQQAIRSGKGLKPEDSAEMMKDPQKIAEMLDSMDRLLCKVVIEPKVIYHRRLVSEDKWEDIPEDERDGDLLYSDEVDMDDKMFIFNYAVGGTRDLERFRSQQAAGLGDVSDVSPDEDPAE